MLIVEAGTTVVDGRSMASDDADVFFPSRYRYGLKVYVPSFTIVVRYVTIIETTIVASVLFLDVSPTFQRTVDN